MERSSRDRRTPSNLPTSLQHRLSAYALAAGAALLALPQSSEAEIVYTPANQVIERNGTYELDLNHDGIIDFVLVEGVVNGTSGGAGSFQSLGVAAAPHNQVNCPQSFCLSTFLYALALFRGSEINPAQRPRGWLPRFAVMAAEKRFGDGRVYYDGSWVNVNDRYLGLRFQINGETHFGWARLSVRFHRGLPKDRTWEAQLTGYAYETLANRPIRAGETTDDAGDATESTHPGPLTPSAFARKPVSRPAQFAALGTLALGADGFPLWRREESESDGKSRDN
jgi:hypothetical protein